MSFVVFVYLRASLFCCELFGVGGCWLLMVVGRSLLVVC